MRKDNKLEALACRVVSILSILLLFVLTASSLIFTRYFVQDYSTEVPYSRSDLLLPAFVGAILLGGAIVWLSGRLADGSAREERRLRLLRAGVLLFCILFGAVWVLLAKSIPIYDQEMVTTSAQRFLEGDYSYLGYGEYLYYYPFQLGLAAWEELVFLIFGAGNVTALQLLNVLGATGTVLAGERVTAYLFQNRRVQAAYLLLSGCCFPLFVSCAYVYGDVLSVFLSMVVLWQFLAYWRKGRKRSVLFLILVGAAAVLLRSNSLIVLIAVVCVWAVKAIARRKLSYLLCIICLCAGVWGGRQVLNRGYEAASGTELNEGMPSILWIAMGMQEGDLEAGWYNEYSLYVYRDKCAYDNAAASEVGLTEVKDRAKAFLADPLYAVDFYARKFTSQWAEPTYGCFIMTYAAGDGRSDFAESLYTGLPNRIFQKFMDSYQLLIYAAAFFLVLDKARKREWDSLEMQVLLIAVLGGAMFHLLWEAKSRYVLPYFVLLIPMAAGGLIRIADKLRGRMSRRQPG